jgi:hypothetical protein
MRRRLTFAASQANALTFAASVHTRLMATNREYQLAVARGQIVRWAIPYQDALDSLWSVNIKDRCFPALTSAERALIVTNGS